MYIILVISVLAKKGGKHIMKKFEHLNFEHRKIINNQITAHKATAIKIAELIGYDPTTVSK